MLSVKSVEEAVKLRDELIKLVSGGIFVATMGKQLFAVLEGDSSGASGPKCRFFFYDPGPITKRAILSEVSRLYDPLGFITPVVFVGKCMLQHLWQLGVGWDEVPPDDVSKIWEVFRRDIPMLSYSSIAPYEAKVRITTVILNTFIPSTDFRTITFFSLFLALLLPLGHTFQCIQHVTIHPFTLPIRPTILSSHPN
ncbi:hypothetical protein J437_LFUL015288 [Ladona fulva]|uniref:Uncharacterized protein n=1 Tax=Ladona fulva TaxID=123851 RepID=A0A8K0P6P7_LADFU|nr:hypothetical protein J437_LFUL015288 [Ladona fulva]